MTTRRPPWAAMSSSLRVCRAGDRSTGLVSGSSGKAASTPTPAVVEITEVVQQDTPIYNEWIATVDGYVNAQIQPHVSG